MDTVLETALISASFWIIILIIFLSAFCPVTISTGRAVPVDGNY